jgi:hypothetical protein
LSRRGSTIPFFFFFPPTEVAAVAAAAAYVLCGATRDDADVEDAVVAENNALREQEERTDMGAGKVEIWVCFVLSLWRGLDSFLKLPYGLDVPFTALNTIM